MADISQINLPNDANNPYDLKDSTLPHSSLVSQEGGTTLSLVTTGEKYRWNRINNVLPGYLVSTYRTQVNSLDITTKAGKVYVSSNRSIEIPLSYAKNIKTLTAVFGSSYIINKEDSQATWLGIQAAYISGGYLIINYVIYKQGSFTVRDARMTFMIIGKA